MLGMSLAGVKLHVLLWLERSETCDFLCESLNCYVDFVFMLASCIILFTEALL